MKYGTGRAAIIVLDGLGIGPAPDTAAYGDAGSDTLGNVARAVGGLKLPNLEKLGLGMDRRIPGLAPGVTPAAAHGIAEPASAGKDSTTGHWEICGVLLKKAFRTYPQGFPVPLLDEFAKRTGRGWLGNKAASGTAIIAELGVEHQRSGKWIVYTSADSVFQVAAHEGTVPLDELYRACSIAREMLIGEEAVSRVIARPFEGTAGDYRRTPNRKDFSIAPTGTTLLDLMADAGVARVGIGKVDDLFAGRNISSQHTPTNAAAYRLIEQALDTLTADHGNDPTTPSTDHSREVVPLLVLGPNVHPVPLGTRRTFADMGQTVAEYFGLPALAAGTSFLKDVSG